MDRLGRRPKYNSYVGVVHLHFSTSCDKIKWDDDVMRWCDDVMLWWCDVVRSCWRQSYGTERKCRRRQGKKSRVKVRCFLWEGRLGYGGCGGWSLLVRERLMRWRDGDNRWEELMKLNHARPYWGSINYALLELLCSLWRHRHDPPIGMLWL